MSDRRTSPESRTHSLPWLSSICFSPRTSAVPLGRTSVMVTESVVFRLLVCAAVPPPLNDESLLALRALGLRKLSSPCEGGVIEAAPDLPLLVVTDFCALTDSASRIVIGSPT